MKRLQQFIRRGDQVERLGQQGAALEAATRIVRDTLPAALRAHVVGCAIKPDALIVFVDQSEWATHFRFLEAEILSAFKKQPEFRVGRVQCRVLPRQAERDSTREISPMSDNTRDLLEQTADTISDRQLADALRRLASRDDQPS